MLRWVLKYWGWFGLLACAIITMLVINDRLLHNFPLDVNCITSNLRYTSATEVSAAIADVQQPGFFVTSISKMRQHVLALPWVASVEVKRLWPNGVSFAIIEHEPFARLASNVAVTREGKIINASVVNQLYNLPVLLGESDKVMEMINYFLRLQKELSSNDYSVSLVEMMADRSWRAIINSSIEIFASNDEFDGELKRLKLVLQRLPQTSISRIAYFDLRYTNGVAIGWKPSYGEDG